MSLDPQEKKALELLHDAVDGVLSAEDQQFFDTVLTQNNTIRHLFNDLITVKSVMAFHANTHTILAANKKETLLKRALEVAKSEIIPSVSTNKKSWQNKWSTRILAIAALITLGWIGSIYVQGSLTEENSFEYFVSASFIDHKGGFIEPTWDIKQNDKAEAAIANVFSYEVHVPVIDGATFIGVVDIEDKAGNHIPMLEYSQEDIGEYIYLFAFDMSKPNKPANKRLRDAIFNCRTQTDYHVSNLDGKHVVSWKWNNTWYSAVSNHNGNDLASLIGPLNP